MRSFQHTIYAWKSKYGGMDVSEAQEVLIALYNLSLLRTVASFALYLVKRPN